MGSYTTVFFDAANTLLYPFPSVGTLYAEVAARYGISTTATEVQTAFRHAWGQIQPQAQADPVRYGVNEPDGRRFWHSLVHQTFAQISLPDNFDTFFDELYHLFAQPDAYRLFPESLEVLQQLQQRNYRLGVISNWDNRLTRILDGLGLTSYLQHVSISAVVGWEKPHREIFQQALNAMGTAPHQALHIGDSLSEDIQGAAQAGLQPLWLQREDSPQSDYPVIQDLRGVLAWLDQYDSR